MSSAEDEKLPADAAIVGLRPTTTGPFGERRTDAGENGSLRFTAVPPGAYWLVTRNDEKTCVQSAQLGEQELLHGRLIVTPGMTARLNVAASKHCGIIKGSVISNERPVGAGEHGGIFHDRTIHTFDSHRNAI